MGSSFFTRKTLQLNYLKIIWKLKLNDQSLVQNKKNLQLDAKQKNLFKQFKMQEGVCDQRRSIMIKKLSHFLSYAISDKVRKTQLFFFKDLSYHLSNIYFNNYMEESQPIRQSLLALSKYPRFSTVEKMEIKSFETALEASKEIALEIKNLVQKKNAQGKKCVLGLATGSSPIAVYKQLIKLHKNGQLSFKNVITFNLDEYYPISHDNEESYHKFMQRQLFDHVDIPKQNINVPSGEIPRTEVDQFCKDYEKKIVDAGGIDLQVLGIGRTGHIGFNEPPSSASSITRMVHLERVTRIDNSAGFNGEENVPKHAITMGISTILNAKKIILMAWSESKALVAQKTIEGPTTIQIPATLLHEHKDCVFYLDRPASTNLSRFVHPWTIRGDIADPDVIYDDYWSLKAVIWLCQKVKKAILRLTYDDYQDNKLSKLVTDVGNGNAQAVNLKAYKMISNKITGWPLGRDKQRNPLAYFSQSNPVQQKLRVVIFSPHPDDDVISMGGTIMKLVKQGHDVHIAYMTSGSFAVFNFDAKKYLDFFENLARETELVGYPQIKKMTEQGFKDILDKKVGDPDTDLIKTVKKLIRRAEATLAVELLGVKRENVISLDLPFYESGKSKKLPVGDKDYNIIRNYITNVVNPHYIYAAGDLTDPHGTHRVCLQTLLKVTDQMNFSSERIILYRGAWQEWQLQMTHSIVPMSPEEISKKRDAIFKHQSQKDRPMFPGNDKREFWQRSQSRNRGTAELLTSLGFTSYEGAECFATLRDLRKSHVI